MLDHRLITFPGRLIDSPERQAGKEDKGSPNTLIPFRLVYVYFHRSEIFSD